MKRTISLLVFFCLLFIVNIIAIFLKNNEIKNIILEYIPIITTAAIVIFLSIKGLLIYYKCLYDIEKNKELTNKNILLEDAIIKANQASIAKSKFLSYVSHDIKTPMNAINGYSYLAIKNINEQEKVLEYLNKITISCNHLESLINNLLDMSCIENGTLKIEKHKINIQDLIYDIENIIKPDLEHKNICFNSFLDDLQHYNIYSDEIKLKQIILNILNNAIKYSKDNGIIILTIREEKKLLSDSYFLKIIIKDNGIGMSKDFIKKIFLPFEREYSSTESQIPGIGLGLAISNELVKLLQGEISVESEKGLGSEFSITLPIEYVKETQMKETGSLVSLSFNNKKVLVVEDNDFNREILVDILKDYCIIVDSANTGLSALDMIENNKEHPYDLIFMDIQMPELDGYETTKIIRTMKEPKISKVPIIAISADPFVYEINQTKEQGMNDYLSKPFKLEQLEAILNKWM